MVPGRVWVRALASRLASTWCNRASSPSVSTGSSGRSSSQRWFGHALHRVESESSRMTVLVDDLLLLARLDSGRPLASETVDMTKLTIDAVADVDHRCPLIHVRDHPVVAN